jgi:putative endonuclease
MSNRKDGTLYIGVTNDLARRVYEHREKLVSGFTRKYNLDQLVYYETYSTALDAIQREKSMKEWNRAWKIELIEQMNPDWRDLYEDLAK